MDNVATTVIDANGTCQFSNNESAAGTYYYRTTYDGNTPHANAASNVVNVSVTPTQTKVTSSRPIPPPPPTNPSASTPPFETPG